MVEYTVMAGVKASIGGILLGIASSIHYLSYNRLTGASGLMEKVVQRNTRPWQVSFCIGVFHAATIYIAATGGITLMKLPYYFFIIGGLLVGFGARLGNGCTSGHGICGLSRFNLRSYVAVGTFMATAIITANLLHHSHTYEYNSGGSGLATSDWLSNNQYLGWAMFVLLALVVLRDVFDIFYPADPESYGTLDTRISALKEISIMYFVGGIFGTGLSLSGMINNGVVLNFLTFNENWDPSLIFVLGWSVMIFGCVFWYDYFQRAEGTVAANYSKESALNGEEAQQTSPQPLPKETSTPPGPVKAVDTQLVIGAALFGIGWGVSGICPAPAISILSVPACAIFFMPACVVGIKLVAVYSAHFEVDETKNSADSPQREYLHS